MAPILKKSPNVTLFLFSVLVLVAIGASLCAKAIGAGPVPTALVVVLILLVAFYILFALKVANQWEKGVVLRYGKYRGCVAPACSGSCRSSIPWRPGSTTG